MDDNGCFSATCGKQKSQDISVAKKCVIKKTVVEDADGCTYIPNEGNGNIVMYEVKLTVRQG